jgi:putative transposase
LTMGGNSIVERWIGSCRRELLDRTLIWNQRHLMTVLREYEDFYFSDRPAVCPGRPARLPLTA